MQEPFGNNTYEIWIQDEKNTSILKRTNNNVLTSQGILFKFLFNVKRIGNLS